MKSNIEIGTSSHSGCACGCSDGEGVPVLDVQTIPHAVRHGAIFGALGQLVPGGALLLRANHDPVPLLAQLQERAPGMYDVDYRERGPQEWALLFTRTA